MRIGLRTALFLTLLPVLILPWVGLRFVGQLAEITRDERREALAGATRTYASALNGRADLFLVDANPGLPGGAQPLLRAEVPGLQIDASDREWPAESRTDLAVRTLGNAPPGTLAVSMAVAAGATGTSGDAMLIDAIDERYVARQEGDTPSATLAGDTIQLWAGSQPDRMQAVALPAPAETNRGWLLEFALPADARFIRLRIDDIDYQANRITEATADSGLLMVVGSSEQADSLARALADQRQQLWDAALAGIDRAGLRLAAYDAGGNLLAMRGEFVRRGQTDRGLLARAARRLLALAVSLGADFESPKSDEPALDSALRGLPAGSSARQSGPDGDPFWVIARAQPVWIDDKVAGALLVEQGSANDLETGQAALEWLALLAALAISATVICLLGLARLLVSRILRLKHAAQTAIDARGRVVGHAPAFRLKDEISELAESYDEVLDRLREHQHYLANLRARLVHEFRTPIMIVRSSLENLQEARAGALADTAGGDATIPADDEPAYVARALGGAMRLERLLASMSEAASLESMLADSQLERVDLKALIAGLVGAYNEAYAPRGDADSPVRFELDTQLAQAEALVVPETIAQAVDKLATNAVDFRRGDAPVVVQLWATESGYAVAVQNEGPPLPEVMAQSLFESMVSVRGDGASEQSHLGLGLYLVRLIAEFHGGYPFARNVDDGVQIGFSIQAG